MAIINQIFMLFGLIVVGYIIRKLRVVSADFVNQLTPLIMNVTLPAFILASMNFEFSMETLYASGVLVIISLAAYAGSIALSKLYSKVAKLDSPQRDVVEYVITFSNCGYMGYPVVAQIFGEQGVFYAAIYNLSFNVLIWTYGVDLLQQKGAQKITLKERLSHLLNPGLFAVVLGFTLFVSQVSLPTPVVMLLKSIGSMTTPLSMMAIGFLLTEINLKTDLNNMHLLWVSVIRLAVIPGLTFLVLIALGMSGLTLYVPVIITAMPAAVNAAVFALRYQSDYRLASLLIFSSTLLSLITVPILMLLIG